MRRRRAGCRGPPPRGIQLLNTFLPSVTPAALDLGGADLPGIAEPLEPDLDADSLLRKIEPRVRSESSCSILSCPLFRRRHSIWEVLPSRVLPSRWSRTLMQTVFCARSSPALWISSSGIVIVAIGHKLLWVVFDWWWRWSPRTVGYYVNWWPGLKSGRPK